VVLPPNGNFGMPNAVVLVHFYGKARLLPEVEDSEAQPAVYTGQLWQKNSARPRQFGGSAKE